MGHWGKAGQALAGSIRSALRYFSLYCNIHVLPVLTAGSQWGLITAQAPWAARSGHTTVIDAAGAIYVIGGYSIGTVFNDVWKSADGGADRTRAGYARGTRECLRCAKGYLGVLNGRDTRVVLRCVISRSRAWPQA